jgi:hypothetical protein
MCHAASRRVAQDYQFVRVIHRLVVIHHDVASSAAIQHARPSPLW